MTKTLFAKIASVVVVLAMVVSFGFAPTAGAQSNDDLQAQITALLATIASLQAQISGNVSGSISCPIGGFTTDLTVGSTGAQAMAVQVFLNSMADTQVAVAGAGAPGMETAYFGALTRAAVIKFQQKYAAQVLAPVGLSVGTGFWGPSSRAHANALCAAPAPTPTPGDDDDDDDSDSDELEGGAGSAEYELISGINNEEVGEGQEDIEVAGLEVEAEGSDLMITAVRIDLAQVSATNDNFHDFADEVSIWLDGEEFARVDADEFDEDNGWEETISLDSGAIIREGDMGDLVVAVSAVNNIDSADLLANEWSADFELVRYEDAQGALISEDPGTGARTFSFESFATATGVEFNISAGDEDINDARVINVDATDDTDGVELFSFEVEVEGSEVDLEGLVLQATIAGTASDLDEMFSTLYLEIDGEEVASENAPAATTTLDFDDVDEVLEEGTYMFTLLGDFLDISATLVDGDTVSWTIGETETDHAGFDAEDEEGNELADADVTGSASSEAHAVYDVGFNIDLVSTSETKTFSSETSGVGDQGQFVIKYEVTAFDGDIYIDNTCVEDNNGSEVSTATSFSTTGAGTAVCNVVSTGDTDAGTAFLIEDGETETITLTVNVTATADAFVQVALEAIGWDNAAGGDDNVFDFNLPGDYETDSLFLNMF
jgi:hypothetical protein